MRDPLHAPQEVTPEEGLQGSSLASLMQPEGAPPLAEVRSAAVLRNQEAALAPRRRPRLQGLIAFFSKAMILSVLAWGFVFNFSEVRGSSMLPGIHDHDRILVDHLSYMLTDVQRGDVVVLRYPLDPSLDYIKRVVGVPGDEVVIRGGEVYINGERLDEPYVAKDAIDRYSRMRVVVRKGNYFVMGDNRVRSSDSREFGQVPFEYLRGKVRFRLWPLERAGLID